MKTDSVQFAAEAVEILAGATDGDKKGPPSFNVRAYNGGELILNGWDLPVVVDLMGMDVGKSVMANLDHDPKQRVGHVTESKVDVARVTLSGLVSAVTAASKEFIDNGTNGYPWKASIEATVPRKAAKEIAAGEKVTVNGKQFVGPLYVAKKSKLHGVGFLSRGADENTSVKIAAAAAGDEQMEFGKWIEAMGLDLATMSDKAKATLQKQYDAEVKAAKKDDDGKPIIAAPKFDVDELRAEYSKHTTDIEVRVAKHEDKIRDKVKLGELKVKAIEAAQALKLEALEKEMAPPLFAVKAITAAHALEIELLKLEADHSGPGVTRSRLDATPAVIEAALCMRLRTPGHEKMFDEKTLEAARKEFKRGVGLQQLLIQAACANGFDMRPGERINDGNLKRILRLAMPDEEIKAGFGFSTVSLPSILTNAANKELLAGYTDEDQTWREVAAIRSVSDFKQITSYRLLDNMVYEALGPGGEIKHGTLGEESYTRQAKTYAKMFAITREMIINDDLGAFEDLRNRLGRGAAQAFNDVFWTEFLSNASTFWATARTNYIEGSTTNLGTDGVGLGLGVSQFRKLRSSAADGSKRISARPEILLVPPELEFIATALFANQNMGNLKVSEANIFAGKYRVVVVPWLSDSAFTGYSTTAWYLLRNPGAAAAVVVSHLNGNQTPTVEQAEADFNVLGVQFRGYHDFGVDHAEYLAGVKSKGAA